MINAYSKIQKENDSLALLRPDEICWKNYYCIYVSLDISDDLIENLGPIRESSDIRMYEIHLFEGAVVLCRADADDFSKDDELDMEPTTSTTRPPHPGSESSASTDPTPILDLNENIPSTYKPKTLVLPNGRSINVKLSWSAVLREIACWLADEGYIKDESQSSLLRAKPLSSKSAQVQLSNGLYVSLNFVSSDILKRTQKLLNDIRYEPNSFKITLSQNGKSVTRPVQSTSSLDLIL